MNYINELKQEAWITPIPEVDNPLLEQDSGPISILPATVYVQDI